MRAAGLSTRAIRRRTHKGVVHKWTVEFPNVNFEAEVRFSGRKLQIHYTGTPLGSFDLDGANGTATKDGVTHVFNVTHPEVGPFGGVLYGTLIKTGDKERTQLRDPSAHFGRSRSSAAPRASRRSPGRAQGRSWSPACRAATPATTASPQASARRTWRARRERGAAAVKERAGHHRSHPGLQRRRVLLWSAPRHHAPAPPALVSPQEVLDHSPRPPTLSPPEPRRLAQRCGSALEAARR